MWPRERPRLQQVTQPSQESDFSGLTIWRYNKYLQILALDQTTVIKKMFSKKFYNEFREVSMLLEKHHAIFYKMWEYGTPVLTNEIPTACLEFDLKHYKPIQFKFNPEFWDNMSPVERSFIVAHECLHAFLNHCFRAQGLIDPERPATRELCNYAMDVAVNHLLVNAYDFVREETPIAETGCWVDTVFPDDPSVSDTESFEYYYRRICKDISAQQQCLGEGEDEGEGEGGSDGEGEGDDSDGEGEGDSESNGKSKSGKGKQGNQKSKNKNKPQLADDHDSLYSGDFNDFLEKCKDHKITQEEMQDFVDAARQCGNDVTAVVKIPPFKGIVFSKKWENLVKNWKRIGLNEPDEAEMWTKPGRRHAGFPDDMILPSTQDPYQDDFCVSRLNAWIFLDVSGSCIHLKDHFFKAYDSMSPKRFNKRLFVFATHAAEVKRDKMETAHVGGGTDFNAINQLVTRIINTENKKPDMILVITDGESYFRENFILPEKWHWFIMDNGGTDMDAKRFVQRYFDAIPKPMKPFMLRDYFKAVETPGKDTY